MSSYAHVEKMLEVEMLDLVMIVSPNNLHFKHLALILGSGTRVFCEKLVVASDQQYFDLLKVS